MMKKTIYVALMSIFIVACQSDNDYPLVFSYAGMVSPKWSANFIGVDNQPIEITPTWLKGLEGEKAALVKSIEEDIELVRKITLTSDQDVTLTIDGEDLNLKYEEDGTTLKIAGQDPSESLIMQMGDNNSSATVTLMVIGHKKAGTKNAPPLNINYLSPNNVDQYLENYIKLNNLKPKDTLVYLNPKTKYIKQ